MLLPSLVQVSESISGSVMPLAMFYVLFLIFWFWIDVSIFWFRFLMFWFWKDIAGAPSFLSRSIQKWVCSQLKHPPPCITWMYFQIISIFHFHTAPSKKETEVKKILVQNTRIQWTIARVFFVFGNEFDPKSHNHLMHLLSNISVFVKHCKNSKTTLVQIIKFCQNSGIWSSSWNVVKIEIFDLAWLGLVRSGWLSIQNYRSVKVALLCY